MTYKPLNGARKRFEIKIQKYALIFFCVSFVMIIFYVLFLYRMSCLRDKDGMSSNAFKESAFENVFITSNPSATNNLKNELDITGKSQKLINILMYTHNYTEPFAFYGLYRDAFIKPGCEFNNCYMTNDKNYLGNITLFDAVLFHTAEYTFTPNLWIWKHKYLDVRSPKQIFIFAGVESGTNYPICDKKWEGYFNWTMSYPLDSDVPYNYFSIRNKNDGKLVGPCINMNWEKNMKNVSDSLKDSLKTKSKAAAWIVSNCGALSNRTKYAESLQKELKLLGLNLDIYGKCGTLKCPRDKPEVCSEYLQNDYFFYLTFENSINEDYITEKALTAVNNKVVPIVWSGVDYSRFLPPGSYIDARHYAAKDLAKMMKRLMENLDEYASYFKWTNYYTYHDIMSHHETHPMCRLCKALNDPDLVNKLHIKTGIRKWWNGVDGDARC